MFTKHLFWVRFLDGLRGWITQQLLWRNQVVECYVGYGALILNIQSLRVIITLSSVGIISCETSHILSCHFISWGTLWLPDGLGSKLCKEPPNLAGKEQHSLKYGDKTCETFKAAHLGSSMQDIMLVQNSHHIKWLQLLTSYRLKSLHLCKNIINHWKLLVYTNIVIFLIWDNGGTLAFENYNPSLNFSHTAFWGTRRDQLTLFYVRY